MTPSDLCLTIGLPLGLFLLILIIYLIFYYKKFIKQSEGYDDIQQETNGPIGPTYINKTNGPEEIPAYVICLSDKVYQQALKNINLPNLQKFDAIKGSSLDPNKLDLTIKAKRSILLDTIRETHADLGTINGVGCYLSHITSCRFFIERYVYI